jgi:RNA polymerase primary sigma factor/RNA polymerase sigma factor
MHANYLNPAIRELRDEQLRFAHRGNRLAVIDRAETILGELEPDRTYSFEHVFRRITNSRSGASAHSELAGDEAIHDLHLLVEDLSDSANIPAEMAGERVVTVKELAERWSVSTKTIARWRRQGLVSRRFVFDNRKRVGFLQSSVDRFVARYPQWVQRGAQFSQLAADEREKIIQRARRLAQAGGRPSDVFQRLARESGRSVETIRYTLKQFNRDHPESPILADSDRSSRSETTRRVYHYYRRGESVEALARRFQRSKAWVRRIVVEKRAQRILELPLDHIPNREFAEVRSKWQERGILGPTPPGCKPREQRPTSAELPAYLASLYEVPLLTREQETHLFRKMNYLKYRAGKLRENLNPHRPRRGLMDQIEELYNESVAVKNQIIRANLRLVVSIAKRYKFPGETLCELISDGNMSLIRAVENFDFARGNKFSTYASWTIMKNFARAIPDAYRHRDRYRTSCGETIASAQDERTDPHERLSAQTVRESQVRRILEQLPEREQKIIVHRFGLKPGQEPKTLQEVGHALGVTKERVRQIEAKALHRLRKAAQEANIDCPA